MRTKTQRPHGAEPETKAPTRLKTAATVARPHPSGRFARGGLAALVAVILGCRSESHRPAASVTERTAAEIRATGNHLVGAASAYLREHAHNPVDWFAWGPEALSLATRLDRPIFLSIGYVSCHWCHVMEKEVFEQDDVATFLNQNFVSIKVDREERPDLDAAYMDAVVTLTGSGGWPMTVFLTPSLHPFFGATYLPRDRFLEAARAAHEKFRTARAQVESKAGEVARSLAREAPNEGRSPLEEREIAGLARRALDDVDPVYGGFRGRTKFPTPVRFAFLLHAYRKWEDPAFAAALKKTLDAMDQGGLHDHVGGGFFRYATEPTWTIPHFEKMLYDNAQLAALYFEASRVLGEPHYRDVALDTIEFLLRDMRTESGGLGASFDADSDGKEGAFYLFSRAEIVAIGGEADGPALADDLGVTERGNFEGGSVLTRRPRQNDGATSKNEALRWERWRSKLYDARRKRPPPFFDSKVVTAWNGLALSALASAYRVSENERFLHAGVDLAAAVWRLNRDPKGELSRASSADRPSERAVLDDYAFFARGLLDMFEISSDVSYLERTVLLAKEAMERFARPAGGWFLTAGADQEPLGRRTVLADSVEPSGNAVMIGVLLRLAELTDRTEFSDAAQNALRAEADTMRRPGLEMAGWLDDALLAGGPRYELVIAGSDDAPSTRSLVQTWNGVLAPWTVGARVGADGPTSELLNWMPGSAGKRDRRGTALAYVCVHGACQAPIADATRLRSALLGGWKR